MNRCIDRRIYIFKRWRNIWKKSVPSLFRTGEGRGQRPKLQMLKAMRIIDEASGCNGIVVRPLSAKLLAKTIPEKEGRIDREKMLSIQWRCRNIQLEFGRNFGIITQYCAGGGCLLLILLLRLKSAAISIHSPHFHGWYEIHQNRASFSAFKVIKVIGGRNETENKDLESWMGNRDYLITLTTAKSPNTLIRFTETDLDVELALETINALIHFASQATILYSDSETEENTLIIKGPNELQEERYSSAGSQFWLIRFVWR